jgi:uncharacterized membrane protein
MAEHHDAATADGGMDMAAHEEMYAQFIELTKATMAIVLSIVLMLVLWGLEGHGGLALIGLILTFIAAAVGGRMGKTWQFVAPVFVLLGLLCIIF